MKRSYLNAHGKVDAEWRRTRAAWIMNNPPNHEGFYVCGICGKSVHHSEMELDHIIARTADPSLRFEFSNLQPSHGWSCNQQKGSQKWEPVISAQEYEFRRQLGL